MGEKIEAKLFGIKDVIKSEDARINYLKGLIRIAGSDNNKSLDEEGFIYKIADILGASYSEIRKAETDTSVDGPLRIYFETNQEKTLFLMQALYMCWLDNDYSDAEREEITRIGNELGIENTELIKIESWIKQGIEWMESGTALLGLE